MLKSLDQSRAGDPEETIRPFAQLSAPAFSKPAFLEVHPELFGHVFTAEEYRAKAHLTEGAFDPQGPIRPGERVRFWIEGDAAYDVTHTISDFGTVDLPHADMVPVAGRTPEAVAQELGIRLARFYRITPRVDKLPPDPPRNRSAETDAARPPPVAGAGELLDPAARLPAGGCTVSSVTDAWGLTDNANPKTVWVFRELKEAGGKRIGVVCDLTRVRQGEGAQDLPLFPGDMVYVTGFESRNPLRERACIRARREYLLGLLGREEFWSELRGVGR
jgi:protein involved in polysaccharide export with SLBB domain